MTTVSFSHVMASRDFKFYFLDFWQSFGEAVTRGRYKTAIFSMENLLVLVHISRRHNNTTNCPDRKRWQYSCGQRSCRLCFKGSLDLRGQIRSSAAGLLGWTVLVKELVDPFSTVGHLGSLWVNLV